MNVIDYQITHETASLVNIKVLLDLLYSYPELLHPSTPRVNSINKNNKLQKKYFQTIGEDETVMSQK